jgi:hypothetical protein
MLRGTRWARSLRFARTAQGLSLRGLGHCLESLVHFVDLDLIP